MPANAAAYDQTTYDSIDDTTLCEPALPTSFCLPYRCSDNIGIILTKRI